VLENDEFVEWANENVVVVVGHTDENHPTETEDEKGKKVPGCPVYPGLTCEQHRAMTGECLNPAQGLPKIAVGNGMPNSWLVAPDGTVEAIESADQQVASKIQELIEAIQKKAGKVVPWKKYEKIQQAFEEGDKAVEAADWKAALAAYGRVAKDAAKMPATITERLDKRVEALNSKVAEAFGTLRDGGEDAGAQWKAVTDLRGKVAAKVGAKPLPALAEIDAWLKDHKSPPKG
jgi:hypothetical protein